MTHEELAGGSAAESSENGKGHWTKGMGLEQYGMERRGGTDDGRWCLAERCRQAEGACCFHLSLSLPPFSIRAHTRTAMVFGEAEAGAGVARKDHAVFTVVPFPTSDNCREGGKDSTMPSGF